MNTNYTEYFIKDRRKYLIKRAIYIILLFVCVLGGFNAGIIFVQINDQIKNIAAVEAAYLGEVLGKYSTLPKDKLSLDINFDLYWQVWDLLNKNYVEPDKVKQKELFYGSLKGLVASLGDPYTVFMDPRLSKEFDDDLSGTFEGIGAELGIKQEILTIIAPLPDSPAEKSGLMPGDKIMAIDGVSTAGISLDEAVSKIRGPKNTEVTLTIIGNDPGQAKDHKIIRSKIAVKSVKTEMKNDIFVIKISSFNDDTEELFKKAAKDVLVKNPKGIILDLRSNPGGYLETAIEVASEWIEEGVVVSEKFNEERTNNYQARGKASLKKYPTVVLVNQGSASASEIIAGALQDYQLAVIVGKKTFGKGSVQNLEELPDGSSVKITIAKWMTPKGNNINDQGIQPDIEVELTPADYENNQDPQLEKAINFLEESR